MKQVLKYKIAVGFLLFVVVLQWVFILSRPKKAPPKIPIIAKARIAIVLDDWGYNTNNLHILEQIRYPLTCSVLPNLNYSGQVSEELKTRGVEVILHLPMEPREKYRLEKNTILTSMDEATIRSIIDEDLSSIAHARGVSNHMGSAATEDQRTMETVFKELKKRHLFFLDSFVTPKSVCSKLARKLGLAFVRRDTFLDNIEEPGYIKEQVYKLKARAKRNGFAVGIGHDRRVTLEVLKEAMPQLESEGYRFVFVSELTK